MMNLLLRILLIVHVCGLAVMAGTTVVDYFTFKIFCNMIDAGDNQAQGLLPVMARFGGLVRMGAGALLLSGVTMVAIKSAWWDEVWFKVKLGLVILLVLNGMFVGNSLGVKFRNMALNSCTLVQKGTGINTNLNRFYLVQLILFILIIFVSVIRPGRPVIH
jgi:uncharacterized membrane protein